MKITYENGDVVYYDNITNRYYKDVESNGPSLDKVTTIGTESWYIFDALPEEEAQEAMESARKAYRNGKDKKYAMPMLVREFDEALEKFNSCGSKEN